MSRLPHRTHRGLAFLALFLLAGGCHGDNPTKPTPVPAEVVPDFHVLDVNPNSASHGDSISPREYLGKISCWYFGHAG